MRTHVIKIGSQLTTKVIAVRNGESSHRMVFSVLVTKSNLKPLIEDFQSLSHDFEARQHRL